MKKSRYGIVFLALFYVLLTVACSGSGGGNTGDLSLSLTDASTPEFEGVYVTISEVQVLVPSDVEGEEPTWEVVASPEGTYNLLELVNGMMEPLGLAELEVGSYDRMRLIIGNEPGDGENLFEEVHPFANYVVVKSEENPEEFVIHELKIPSGFNTGLKIMKGFEILSGQTTDLLLDFHAMSSVIRAGNSGQWLLKPTINVVAMNESDTIEGFIIDETTGEPLEGVQVTIQKAETGEDTDDADGVVTSTVTDENGGYLVYVEPGVYTVVITIDGYETQVIEVDTGLEEDINLEIVLVPSVNTGDVEGEIVVDETGEDLFVSLSFMMVTIVDGVEKLVEVESVNIGDGGEYDVSLEDGLYTVVARFFMGDVPLGEKTYETVVVLNGLNLTLNIVLDTGDEDDMDDVDDDSDEGDDQDDVDDDQDDVDDDQDDADDGDDQDDVDDGDDVDDDQDDMDDDDDQDDMDDDDDGEDDGKKVTVCHNGHEITISRSALAAHLDHGDTEGPCPNSDDADDGETEDGASDDEDSEDGDSDDDSDDGDDDSEDGGETV